MTQIQSLEEKDGFVDFARERYEFESKEHFLYRVTKNCAPTGAAKEEVRPIVENGLSPELQEELLRARLKNARLTFKENWQRWTDTTELWLALNPGNEKQRTKVLKQLKRSADKCLYYAALIEILCGILEEEIQEVY